MSAAETDRTPLLLCWHIHLLPQWSYDPDYQVFRCRCLLEKIRRELNCFDRSMLGKLKMKGIILKELPKFIDETRAPDDLNLTELILSVFIKGTRDSLVEFHTKSFFLGIMHFQDLYNMDLDKLERCGIHYALPDGRIIPFCSYNTVHRFDQKIKI
jgi:uncharacterized radical SAM superfamily Fe-S cluster-containing enzyme